MTIKKKIAAIAAAAMMTMSITAITASADQPLPAVYEDVVKGCDVLCTLWADTSYHIQGAYIEYFFLNEDGIAEVRSTLHVDNYNTGELLGYDKKTSKALNPVTMAECDVDDTPISLFGAYEVYPDGVEGWGHYLSLHGIVQ